jgi:hypothetical protein
MRLKKFNQFKIFETLSISEIESSMSDFLDEYDYYLENIEYFNLVVLKDAGDINFIYNLFKYDTSLEKFDEKFFSSLEKIENLIPRSEISKSLKLNIIFTSRNHHMEMPIQDRSYYEKLAEHIENLISQNKIKSYPIVKLNMNPSCFWKNSKEHFAFISSLKSLFNQTGLRPIGRTWYEDYIEDETDTWRLMDDMQLSKITQRLCFAELMLIDCEDDEYRNLYEIFRFKEGNPDKELFEIFI